MLEKDYRKRAERERFRNMGSSSIGCGGQNSLEAESLQPNSPLGERINDDALNWLKANNELYETITIDIERIDRNLTTLEVTSIPECTTSTSTDVEQPMNEQDISTDEIITEQINEPKNEKPVINDTSRKAQQEEQEEEIDDPLNEHRAPTNETCIQAIIPDYSVTIDQQNVSTGQEIYSIVPGENKHPVSFIKHI